MSQIQRLQSEDTLKILGNSTRLAILRSLMAQPATISQLGETLGQHPAQVLNHIRQLIKAGMVELESVQTVRNYTEKYYQATARAFFVNLTVLPEPGGAGQLVILGSDGPALGMLTDRVNLRPGAPRIYTLPVGSLDGLIYLRENYCQICGCHLFDYSNGEFNLPFVRHLFSDQDMILVILAYRQQGLLVAPGNPKHITSLGDVRRPDVRFINRKRGSGTRLRFDQELRRLNILPEEVQGYTRQVETHNEVAQAIGEDQADVGLSIHSMAFKYHLDFIPLFGERYDLVMTQQTFESAEFQPVLEVIQSPEYHHDVMGLGGYSTTHTGEIIRV